MNSRFLLQAGRNIHYLIAGSGEPLLLLHGYQADSRIWSLVLPLLEKNFKVIIPDLPGHGKSPLMQSVNQMNFLAEIAYKICLSLGISGVSIAGHSMGGYVALAIAEKHPAFVDNLILINSHPFADSITKSLSRNREAEIIQEGRKHMLLRNFIKSVFSEDCIENPRMKMELAMQIALNQPEDGMLADLSGMMARKDQSSLLIKTRFPVLVISGKNDERIENLKQFCEGKKNITFSYHENSGHLSILENPNEIADKLIQFLQ